MEKETKKTTYKDNGLQTAQTKIATLTKLKILYILLFKKKCISHYYCFEQEFLHLCFNQCIPMYCLVP